MSESASLQTARAFIESGEREKALPLLLELLSSKNPEIKLDAGLALLAALDQLTQNEKLLEVTDKTIEIALALRREDTRVYLVARKAQFLGTKLSDLTYQQHNLNIAAGIFKWIDFSLEIDKAEFEHIVEARAKIKREIAAQVGEASAAIQSSKNHYMRGHILATLGEIEFSQFLDDQLDLHHGGKMRSKMLNIYFIRRWHVDRLIGYDRIARKKLKESLSKSASFFNAAIEAFRAGNYTADLAHTLYGFATKFALTFRFRKAQQYLNQAKQIAEAENVKALFASIEELQKRIDDRYKHPRNYVEELGLDLPRSLRK